MYMHQQCNHVHLCLGFAHEARPLHQGNLDGPYLGQDLTRAPSFNDLTICTSHRLPQDVTRFLACADALPTSVCGLMSAEVVASQRSHGLRGGGGGMKAEKKRAPP